MYDDIADSSDGEAITFQEAYEQIEAVYRQVADYHQYDIPEDYRRVFRIHIVGRGDGVFSIEFKDGHMEIHPNFDMPADAEIAASLDHLIGMAKGEVSADKLFLSGQLKVTGNIVKGAEMRRLLTMSM